MPLRQFSAFLLFLCCSIAANSQNNIPGHYSFPDEDTGLYAPATFPPLISSGELTESAERLLSGTAVPDVSLTVAPTGKDRKQSFFRTPYARFIIPTAMITYGVVTRGNPLLLKGDHWIHENISNVFPGKATFDDFTQYVPLAALYGLDLCGVKAEHRVLDRTVIAATSYLIMAAAVNAIKLTIHVQRPDGTSSNSFPSGHTATAFTGAHLLFREYYKTSPWIGVAGYAVASLTGIMRMMNKRHWFSDVITGAGIGIASVELAYLLYPVFERWIYGDKRRNGRGSTTAMTIAPIASHGYIGAGFSCVF